MTMTARMASILVRLMVPDFSWRGMNRSSANPMLISNEIRQITHAMCIPVLPIAAAANPPAAI